LVYFINKNVTAHLGFHPIFIHYENWKIYITTDRKNQ
jgi:hypothetical protein